MKTCVTLTSLAVFALTFAQAAFATPTEEDGCSAVLRLTGHDETLEHSSSVARKYIYDHYCEGSSLKQGVSLDVGATDLLDSFDIGFGSTEERVRQVCKTFTESDFMSSQSYFHSSVVVRDAIQAWIDCKQLSDRRIKVRPRLGQESFNIDFEQSTGSPVTVNGINYLPEVAECTGLIGNDAAAHLDKSTQLTIKDGIPWTITCHRKAVTGQNVAAYYPEMEISVPTSGLTFRMTVPRSVLPTMTWLLQIEAQQRDVLAALGTLQRDEAALRKDPWPVLATTPARLCVITADSCPSGWFPVGSIGLLAGNAVKSHGNFGMKGAEYSGEWSWRHPGVCCTREDQ
jgi:hypothetical protein